MMRTSRRPTRVRAPDGLERIDAWARAVAREHLIDLAEWADARSRERLTPYPCAFTARLWSFLESIPFGEIGRTSLDQRVETLHRCATRALERAEVGSGAPIERSQRVVHFTSPLRARSDEARRQVFALRAELSDAGLFVVVVGLGWEMASKLPRAAACTAEAALRSSCLIH